MQQMRPMATITPKVLAKRTENEIKPRLYYNTSMMANIIATIPDIKA